MLSIFLFPLCALLAGYIAICSYMYANQRRLIYFPDKIIAAPEQYGLHGFEEAFTTTPDGINLHVWYRPARAGFPTIAYFHGNAGTMANRAGLFAALTAQGFGLLALSYRGYGKSAGTPSEQGLYKDARAAIQFLTQQQHLPLNRIMLYGESLGTGVAVQMASEFPAAALVLQAPYLSVTQRAAELYYWLPVRLLSTDRFASIDKIKQVHMPILLYHGHLDPTIPLAHGKALFNAANDPKQGIFLPDRAHNDFDSGVISAHVLDFAHTHQLITL